MVMTRRRRRPTTRARASTRGNSTRTRRVRAQSRIARARARAHHSITRDRAFDRAHYDDRGVLARDTAPRTPDVDDARARDATARFHARDAIGGVARALPSASSSLPLARAFDFASTRISHASGASSTSSRAPVVVRTNDGESSCVARRRGSHDSHRPTRATIGVAHRARARTRGRGRAGEIRSLASGVERERARELGVMAGETRATTTSLEEDN